MSQKVFTTEIWRYEPVPQRDDILTGTMNRNSIDSNNTKKPQRKKSKKKKKEHKRKRKKSVENYHGIRSLFAIRMRLRKSLKGREVPLLNIIYTTAFLQFFIVICITALITLRKDTEFFFLNTTQTFNAIFKLSDDIDTNLLRTGNLINSLHTKYAIFFNLTKQYSDHYIYPDYILIENVTDNTHHQHNLIPSALLTFNMKDQYLGDSSVSYQLTPHNYSILSSNTSSALQSLIQASDHIHSQFEIESYSFINDVRNSWQWHIDCDFAYTLDSKRMIPSIHLSYDKIDTSVSWWNKYSVPFMGSVIASFGLCAFSIMALTRFTYKYGFCFMCDPQTLKELEFRIILPISHLISLLCGLVYLINLSNVADLNDTSSLRLLIAVCVWLSWCMMLFTVQRQGTEYGALFKTLRTSFKPIVILVVSFFPIAMGFILFGSLIFGVPNGDQMFSTPEFTAKTLYAVWLGDEVHDTFLAVGVGNVVAEVYMYVWGILFIAIIFNVGLAIVESNFFVTIPGLEKEKDHYHHAVEKEDVEDNEDLSDTELCADSCCESGWTLDRGRSYRNEMFLLSNGQNGSNCIGQSDDDKHEAIPLGTVFTLSANRGKVTKVKTKRGYQRKVSNFKLDEEEIKQRNKKYGKLFTSHLKRDIINTISEGLIDRNVRKLLHRFPIDSQTDLDLLKEDILKQYQLYLINVRNKLTQFVNATH